MVILSKTKRYLKLGKDIDGRVQKNKNVCLFSEFH